MVHLQSKPMERVFSWPGRDGNYFLHFKREFIEALKTRTEAKKTKENKRKQPRRALKIQSLPSASGKWITYAWYD